MSELLTTSSDELTYFTEGRFKDRKIIVRHCDMRPLFPLFYPCIEGHDLEEIDHYGTPTGMIQCMLCGGFNES